MPTVLALAKVGAPEGVEGTDLLSSSEYENRTFSAATKHREGVHAVRTERYKLIFDARTRAVALFDLTADSAEYRDISAENEAKALELLALLTRHIEEARGGRLRPENADIPEEIRRRLEALGYLKETRPEENP